MMKNLVFIHKTRHKRGQPLHDQKTDQGHSLTSRLLKFMKVNTGQPEWRLAEKHHNECVSIKCLKVSVRWEADGKDDIGEVVLAGFYQKPADMDLKASRRNLMFTTGHPVCRFHTDHRRSKTLKSSWRRMCCRSGPWHRPCKHYLLVSEGMLQYVGSHFEWKWKTGKLHDWDDFCNARFVFNHFLIDATHVPSVELISTVGIYGSVTHLKKLQLLLVQLYLERWTQHCWNWGRKCLFTGLVSGRKWNSSGWDRPCPVNMFKLLAIKQHHVPRHKAVLLALSSEHQKEELEEGHHKQEITIPVL